MINWLQEWPQAPTRPRPYYRGNASAHGEMDESRMAPTWLLSPPPTMMQRFTAMPVTTMSRLFQDRFWSVDVARFGLEALKFPTNVWEGRPLKSSFTASFVRPGDIRSSFESRKAWRWLVRAFGVLIEAGEDNLANFLTDRALVALGPGMLRRRFHYEKKRWQQTDARFREISQEVAHLRAVPINMASVETQLQSYILQGQNLISQAMMFNRLLGTEIQALQYFVLVSYYTLRRKFTEANFSCWIGISATGQPSQTSPTAKHEHNRYSHRENTRHASRRSHPSMA